MNKIKSALILPILLTVFSPTLGEEKGSGEIVLDWLEGSWSQRQRLRELEEQKRAPRLEVTAWRNSSPVTLSQLEGKIVLLVFWASWSQPSLASVAYLNQLFHSFKSEDLMLIGVCASEGGELVDKVVKNHTIQFPVAVDVEGRTVAAYRVDGFPDYYIIDREGLLYAADCKNGRVGSAITKLLGEGD